MASPLSHKAIRWVGGVDGHIEMIDQTLLPGEFKVIACRDVETLRESIGSLRIRTVRIGG